MENNDVLLLNNNHNLFLSNNPKKILTYTIKYLDNSEIKKGDILESNDKKTIIVRIDYPKQKNKVYDKLELNLSLELQYKALY